MQIQVKLDKGYLSDEYAKYASVKEAGNPVVSFPFTLTDLPEGTKYLAWSLVDYDSIPVCGFAWIHWLASDVPAVSEIPADFSRTTDTPQGYNSTVSRFLTDPEEVHTGYIGPTPPDKDHDYRFRVYALSKKLDLEQPYYYNEFLRALKGKVLAESQVDLPARV
ncbi:YbhB/YbcL family Raf kinase inhibitor-like protein [Lactobacillus delbrueckii]|uniref:YbhB/YbcL family Raf kinase inhibitor-like protein n=1 Tax=Lactobacillus delbrueckii TaxID=1584 RepID=UPI0030E9A9C0